MENIQNVNQTHYKYDKWIMSDKNKGEKYVAELRPSRLLAEHTG
jgi:hypothetical protein